MANLATLLETHVSKNPAAPALVHGTTVITYADLDAAASQVAHLLVQRGVLPGDRVALSCSNTPWFTIANLGILKAGAVVVPLNILLKAREVAYHVADSQARVHLAFAGTPEMPIGDAVREAFDQVDSCTDLFVIPGDQGVPAGTSDLVAATSGLPTEFASVERADDDTAVILYTSGTTGAPKGAELSHSNLTMNAEVIIEMLRMRDGEPQRVLGVLPLFHSFAQTVVQNATLATGGRIVLLSRFEPRAAVETMIREGVTLLAGVPTMFWAMLRTVTPIEVEALRTTLRHAVSGGSALAGELHRDFAERFGLTVCEGYGLSETSPAVCFTTPDDPAPVGSVGRPVRGVEVALRDPQGLILDGPDLAGEIIVRGHNVMKGYYGRPEATAEVLVDGWFHTGDIGRRDAEGNYYIVDRVKDLVIRGGFNVYPRELEEVLMTHPAVSLVAVIGVPHESHGEEVKAFVVKREGDATTEEELIAWCREEMAAYKYPRLVEFVETMPMTSSGKILKRALAGSGA